ncbi:hypothetical protein IX308_000451 [Porphyromonas levii]|uniref:hypothetical protein n=1 Tax=Porphyromonas levii TaxID=28114 RepID=UPI001BA5761C|nr:hypothetical protein [Porphyromonas levii]MBR8784282.1 hypothetical protein [Porphyromonas levii]
MKKIITIALLALAMLAAGCENKDKPKILKDGAMLYINVKEANMKTIRADVPTVDGDEYTRLTPAELVEKADIFLFFNKNMGNNGQESNISIAPVQKDVANARIKMWGEMIINSDGSLDPYFIELRDIRIGIGIPNGYIGGYIPNAVMEKAEKEIKQAYSEGRLDDVYRLFDEAYTAIPCTEKEWLNLKAQGLQ